MLTVVLSEWCSYGWGRFVLTFLHFSKLLPAHKPLKLEKKIYFFKSLTSYATHSPYYSPP